MSLAREGQVPPGRSSQFPDLSAIHRIVATLYYDIPKVMSPF